jgi:hypothetical protein
MHEWEAFPSSERVAAALIQGALSAQRPGDPMNTMTSTRLNGPDTACASATSQPATQRASGGSIRPRHHRIAGLLAAAALLLGVGQAMAQVNVGVSVEVSQPGVYGRVDIGNRPPPQIYVPQPVIIAPPPRLPRAEAVYLWVPLEHRRNWKRHCGEYRACGVPVYFVRDDWYRDNIHRGEGRRNDHGHGHDRGRHRGHDHDHGDRRDDRRDDRGDDHGGGRGGRDGR